MTSDTAACRCGHERADHSPAREDDFGCRKCACNGFAPAASIPYEGTDCTADEAVEAVKAVRATAACRWWRGGHRWKFAGALPMLPGARLPRLDRGYVRVCRRCGIEQEVID